MRTNSTQLLSVLFLLAGSVSALAQEAGVVPLPDRVIPQVASPSLILQGDNLDRREAELRVWFREQWRDAFDRQVTTRQVRSDGWGRDKWRIEADDVVVCVDAASGAFQWDPKAREVAVDAMAPKVGGTNASIRAHAMRVMTHYGAGVHSKPHREKMAAALFAAWKSSGYRDDQLAAEFSEMGRDAGAHAAEIKKYIRACPEVPEGGEGGEPRRIARAGVRVAHRQQPDGSGPVRGGHCGVPACS